MNKDRTADIVLFTLAGAAVGGIFLTQRFYSKKHGTESGIGARHPSACLSKYKNCIYLDYNATTPIFEEVSDAMRPFTVSCFGNPSSPHIYARPCKEAMNVAREHIARLIHAEDVSCVILTSCGSESDNRAIDIGLSHFVETSSTSAVPHVVSSEIEHPAILEYLKYLVACNRIELTVIGVNSDGVVDPAQVAAALQDNTALVTIMHSNNEVGTLQPIRTISHKIQMFNAKNRSSGPRVLFHSDGAQTIGKVPVDVLAEGLDMLTVVGHKFGAPKGVAALYVREGIRVRPFFYGGGQEGGRRAGTENVMLAVALGEAARIAYVEAQHMLLHLLKLRKHFLITMAHCCQQEFGRASSDIVHYNGPAVAYDVGHIHATILACERRRHDDTGSGVSFPVLPNTISVSFKGVRASQLMPLLVEKVACSSGTTCHSCHSADALSTVLAAMKVPVEYGTGTLRLSFGRHTTDAEVEIAVASVVTAAKSLL